MTIVLDLALKAFNLVTKFEKKTVPFWHQINSRKLFSAPNKIRRFLEIIVTDFKKMFFEKSFIFVLFVCLEFNAAFNSLKVLLTVYEHFIFIIPFSFIFVNPFGAEAYMRQLCSAVTIRGALQKSHKCDFGAEPMCRIYALSAPKGLRHLTLLPSLKKTTVHICGSYWTETKCNRQTDRLTNRN